MKRQVASVTSVLFFVVACLLVQSASAETKLLSPAPDNQVMTAEATAILEQEKSVAAVKSVLVAQADVSTLTAATKQIELELSRDLTATIGELRMEGSEAGPIGVWHGRVQEVRNAAGNASAPADIAGGEVILAVNGTMISGTVRYAAKLFRIVPLGGREHAIIELDESLIPPEGDQETEGPLPVSVYDTVKSERADIPIRIMLVMSKSAQARIADPQGLARLMFAEANQGLQNSGLAIRFESAGIFAVNYNEEGGVEGFEKALAGIGTNSEIQHLRRESFADTVVMLVTNNALAGKAHTRAVKSTAFAVVSVGYATGNYTFAHEVGHNIGAGHEGTGSGYAHGYQQKTVSPYWRTIMAYECSPRCPRVNYFSDPDRRYNGLPMGVVGNSENTRVIRERGPTVAAFFPELPGLQMMLVSPGGANSEIFSELSVPILPGLEEGVVALSPEVGPTELIPHTGHNPSTRLNVKLRNAAGRDVNVVLWGRRIRSDNCKSEMNALAGCTLFPLVFRLEYYPYGENEALPAGYYNGVLKLEARRPNSDWKMPINIAISVRK
ncbi:M12 family metallo-peptidase [Pseudomonas batumici]|uniref:Peptidyl-Asp metalloendopeptidase n=1 Tax=Pseudomonas batumici TaxID=226910 RepID=A0A0C2EBS9_9PSED|nr:M12 family metallo-peptidase [Pseudomonas batumici]KIH83334.1 Peptidyl-Asp metalloendopeptidase [Pseudomonas batumici]